jgi:hypothetical protein
MDNFQARDLQHSPEIEPPEFTASTRRKSESWTQNVRGIVANLRKLRPSLVPA